MLILVLNLFIAIAIIVIAFVSVISAIKAIKIAFTLSEKEVIADITS